MRATNPRRLPVVLWGGHPDKTVQFGSLYDRRREAMVRRLTIRLTGSARALQVAALQASATIAALTLGREFARVAESTRTADRAMAATARAVAEGQRR